MVAISTTFSQCWCVCRSCSARKTIFLVNPRSTAEHSSKAGVNHREEATGNCRGRVEFRPWRKVCLGEMKSCDSQDWLDNHSLGWTRSKHTYIHTSSSVSIKCLLSQFVFQMGHRNAQISVVSLPLPLSFLTWEKQGYIHPYIRK